MKRLTRLTNILIHLQSKRVIRAKELADKFKITQRTVYRDIRTLEEAGIPIIGEAGKGYSLVEGYRIPPVMFTELEISALLTAQKYLKNNPDKSLYDNLASVVTKIKAIIRYSDQEKAEKLEDRVHIFSREDTSSTNLLANIQSAIINCFVLRLKYHSLHGDIVTERDVEPLAVYLTKENWILIAYCRLRKDFREFRLDRILKLESTFEPFPEGDFVFEDYIRAQSKK